MNAHEFEEWKNKLSEKIEKTNLSPNEVAGFFLILKGFSQSGQYLDRNAEIIVEALKLGEFEIWKKKFTLQPADFFSIDFKSEKWLTIIGSAMNGLHARVKENPKSLLFLSSPEKNSIAAGMFGSIQSIAKKIWEEQK